MKTNITLKPGDSVRGEIPLSQEAVKRINSGKAIKVKLYFQIPWLSSPWVKGTVLMLAGWGLADIMLSIIKLFLTSPM